MAPYQLLPSGQTVDTSGSTESPAGPIASTDMLSTGIIVATQQQDGGEAGMIAPHHPTGTPSGPQSSGIAGPQQINICNHDDSMQVENNVNVEMHAALYQQLNVAVQSDNGQLVMEAWNAINQARNESRLIGERAAEVLQQASDENQVLRVEAEQRVMAAQADAEVHLRAARVQSQVAEQAQIGINAAQQQARESELARQHATAAASEQSHRLQQVCAEKAAEASRGHMVIRGLQQQIDHLRSQPPSLTNSLRMPSSSPSPVRTILSDAREPQCTTEKSTPEAQVMTDVSANVASGDGRHVERVIRGGSARRSSNQRAVVNHTAVPKADTAVRSSSQRVRMASPLRTRKVLTTSMAGPASSRASGSTMLPLQVTYCIVCGAQLPATVNFCGSCGGKVTRDSNSAKGLGGTEVGTTAPQFPTAGSSTHAPSPAINIAPALPQSLFQDIEGVQEIGSTIQHRQGQPDDDPDSSNSSDSDDDDGGAGGGGGGGGPPGGWPDDYDYDEDDQSPGGDHPMLDLWGQASPAPKPDDYKFQVEDENAVYKSRELPITGTLPDLPRDAAEYRGYVNAIIAIFAALDLSSNDILTKWLLKPFNVTGDARPAVTSFHQDSQGLIRLDRWIAKEMLVSKNLLNKIFGGQFSTYVEWCVRHGVSPRGRVLLVFVALRFRLDRSRGKLLNQMHLFNIQLTSFKHGDIKSFMDKVRLVLASINVGELRDHDLMFQWLFEKFRSWKAIDRTIEKIKESRSTSTKRTWNYLWAAINTYLTNHNEDDNCLNLETALAGRTVGAAAAVKGKKKKKKEAAEAAAAEEEKKRVDAAAAYAKGKGKGKKGKGKGKKGKGEEHDTQGYGLGGASQQQYGQDLQKNVAQAKATPHKDRTPQQKKMLLCNAFKAGKCRHANGKDCEYSHSQQLVDASKKAQKQVDAAAAKFNTAVDKAAAEAINKQMDDLKKLTGDAKNSPPPNPKRTIAGGVAALTEAFNNIVAERS